MRGCCETRLLISIPRNRNSRYLVELLLSKFYPWYLWFLLGGFQRCWFSDIKHRLAVHCAWWEDWMRLKSLFGSGRRRVKPASLIRINDVRRRFFNPSWRLGSGCSQGCKNLRMWCVAWLDPARFVEWRMNQEYANRWLSASAILTSYRYRFHCLPFTYFHCEGFPPPLSVFSLLWWLEYLAVNSLGLIFPSPNSFLHEDTYHWDHRIA